MKPKEKLQDLMFTANDLKDLFHRKKEKLFRIACFAWAFFFLISLVSPVRYKVEAKFKEERESVAGKISLKDFFGQLSSQPQEPKASVLMQSKAVLKPLIQKLGLQATVPLEGVGSKICRRIQENLQLERGKRIADLDLFSFKDVLYEGEETLSFFIVFDDPVHFKILDKNHQLLSYAIIGSEARCLSAQFVIEKHPKNLRLQREYKVQIVPWASIFQDFCASLKIQSDKIDPSIYQLKYLHRDRHFAVKVLNELMNQYQRHLKKGYEEVAQEEMMYLDQRQEEIYSKLNSTLEEYAAHQAKNFQERGFGDLEAELKSYLELYHKLLDRSISISIELSRLDKKDPWIGFIQESPLLKNMTAISQEIYALLQEKELLEVSLRKKNLIASRDETLFIEKEIKTEGISLEIIRQLLSDASRKCDDIQALMQDVEKLQEEMDEESFSFGACLSILKDPLSMKVAEEAAGLVQQLKDDKHRGSKEQLRLKEELRFKQNVLKDQFKEVKKTQAMQKELIEEKIARLQKMELSCIQQKIGALELQAKEVMQDTKEALIQELSVLKTKMEELRTSYSHLPEKWRLEKWLALKTEVESRTMQAVAEVAESKILSHYLHHVQSKPLDLAALPLRPKPSLLFFKASLGSFVAFLMAFLFFFLKTLFRGFPSSLSKLKALQYPVAGELSSFCDGPEVEDLTGDDLETVRRLVSFLEPSQKGQVVSLIAGKGPNYAYALMQNLRMRHLRALLIDTDFRKKFQSNPKGGLLPFLKGEIQQAPIETRGDLEEIRAGGFTPYGVEFVQSPAFQTLLDSFKRTYDVILVVSRARLEESEGILSLTFSDKAIVTVAGEPTELLTPFINWAYDKEKCRLNFIVTKAVL